MSAVLNETKKKIIHSIAIDGPSGAGKSSLAKMLAEKLGFSYVDTGAIYRTVGYAVYMKGISPDDTASVISALPSLDIDVRYEGRKQEMYLDGMALGDRIRTPEISEYASKVSAIPEVRTLLLSVQRSIAEKESVIMDGRDIGTVILPDADVKIFLSASAENRAMRRYLELEQRGEHTDYETVLRDMAERDRRDSERDVAPLRPAEDAVELDNSALDLEQTMDAALAIVYSKLPGLLNAGRV